MKYLIMPWERQYREALTAAANLARALAEAQAAHDETARGFNIYQRATEVQLAALHQEIKVRHAAHQLEIESHKRDFTNMKWALDAADKKADRETQKFKSIRVEE